MSTVRAKFKVDQITRYAHSSSGVNITLSPVYSADPNHENKAFWDATPSGSLTMHIKSAVGEKFELGKEYYVDFTPAEQ